jgi:hypothetical protein
MTLTVALTDGLFIASEVDDVALSIKPSTSWRERSSAPRNSCATRTESLRLAPAPESRT